MVLFRLELARRRSYLLGWAVALFACIFVMTPVYYQLVAGAMSMESAVLETLGDSDFFRSIGMSIQFLTEPLGVYAFVTSFFAIAAAVFGMNLGISLFTADYAEGAAEVLYTKPHTRAAVFGAKACVTLVGTVLVGGAYVLASYLALNLFVQGFDWRMFFLIAGTLPLLMLIFAAMGLFIGVLFPKNRSPLLTAGLVVFVLYCLASFARAVGHPALGLVSPFSFFTAAQIAASGSYGLQTMLWYPALLLLSCFAARAVFLRRDL